LLNKETNEIIKGYFQCNNNLPLRPCNNFVTNNITKESFFYYPYNDTIYRVENNEIDPFIHIDFGTKKCPFPDINAINFIENINSVDYLGSIKKVYMYGDMLFFSFNQHYGGSNKIDRYNCFISLKDLSPMIYTIDIVHAPDLPLPPLPEIIGLSDNKLIFQIVPGVLPERVFDRLKHTKYENIITEDSNPVLVLYELSNIE
jgi:hypothetical protein